MWGYLVFSVFIISAFAFNNSALDKFELLKIESRKQKVVAVRGLAKALNYYFYKKAITPPVNLSTLIVGSDSRNLNALEVDGVGYEVAEFTDEKHTYNKVVLFYIVDNKSKSDYLSASNNKCGSEDFYTSENWCPNDNSIWFVVDNRAAIDLAILHSLSKMDELLQKLADSYTLNGYFPNKYFDDSQINDGESVLVSSAAGFTGSDENCNGVFYWQGANLSCYELFNTEGTSFLYTRHSDDFISVSTFLSIKDNNGNVLKYSRNIQVM